MDKSWMHADRRSQMFSLGVDELLMYALESGCDMEKISCPCMKCSHGNCWTTRVVKNHLVEFGIDESYKKWIWHGEGDSDGSSSIPGQNGPGVGEPADQGSPSVEGSDDGEFSTDSDDFMEFVEDGDKPLYPDCTRFTKMTALVKTHELKAKHGITDACFWDMLLLIGKLLPEGNVVPSSLYMAKKSLTVLGLSYEKIHSCPNDCILYRGTDLEATSCRICGLSRWKLGNDQSERFGVPAKVLWYFPPIPRFKKMFQSFSTAKNLSWHANERLKDDKMRHPADSPTWKLVDEKWPSFGAEPRNLRLALSSDGFNPHSSLSSKYSCWPVILVTYNLPPWLCMKRKYMMLTLLIQGPKQPGDDIDVYLQLLIDDLKKLWEGVDGVYDSFLKVYFTLRAVLFLTINDFPAYGNLSGSVVKGYKACPICLDDLEADWLVHGQKCAYQRHQRFLPRDHPFRKQVAAFNNKKELDGAPVPISGEEVFKRVQTLNHVYGKIQKIGKGKGGKKGVKKSAKNGGQKGVKKSTDPKDKPCWHKQSVFFQLEYWMYLPVRHILDLMHIEKNILEALLGTLLNIPGKSKDGLSARLDLKEIGIRTGLWVVETGGKRNTLPLGSWNLKLDEKNIVCSSLLGMKLANRFSSNIKSLVSMNTLTLVGMKSHDCHTLLHHLLPVVVRSVLDKPVRYAIIKFCHFSKAICSKVVDVEKLGKLQADLVETVCELEKFFPPSFFDIMIHLSVHLVREVELCGPVFLRLMYPFERYMKTLKGYVKSRNNPEGCIAEKYIAEEAVEFLSECDPNQSTVGIPVFDNSSGPLSCAFMINPDSKHLQLAHLCVLQNTDDVRPYFDEHTAFLKRRFPEHAEDEKWLKEKQNNTFCKWIEDKVAADLVDEKNNVSEHMRWIADGPALDVPSFDGYKIDGVNFNTKDRDNVRQYQCSGASLLANAMLVSSAKDKNPVNNDTIFYGVIRELWELDYHSFRVPIFFCDWVDIDRGIKIDDLGYTLVNLNKLGHFNDPFVLGTDVKQVCYVDDPLNANWSVAIICPNRDYLYGNEEDSEVIDLEVELLAPIQPIIDTAEVGDQRETYMRDGEETVELD